MFTEQAIISTVTNRFMNCSSPQTVTYSKASSGVSEMVQDRDMVTANHE